MSKSNKKPPKFVLLNASGGGMISNFDASSHRPPPFHMESHSPMNGCPVHDHQTLPNASQRGGYPTPYPSMYHHPQGQRHGYEHHNPAMHGPEMRCQLCERQASREPLDCHGLLDSTLNCFLLPFEGMVRCLGSGMRTFVSSCEIAGRGCENAMTGCNTAVESSFMNCERNMYQRMGHHSQGGCPIHGHKAMQPSHALGPPPPSASHAAQYHQPSGHLGGTVYGHNQPVHPMPGQRTTRSKRGRYI